MESRETMSLGEAGKDAMEGEEVVRVASSILLDAVKTGGDRSTARLQCGHEFHLDCLGRTSIRCNALIVKKFRNNWLYANGYRPTPEFALDEDL